MKSTIHKRKWYRPPKQEVKSLVSSESLFSAWNSFLTYQMVQMLSFFPHSNEQTAPQKTATHETHTREGVNNIEKHFSVSVQRCRYRRQHLRQVSPLSGWIQFFHIVQQVYLCLEASTNILYTHTTNFILIHHTIPSDAVNKNLFNPIFYGTSLQGWHLV